MANWDIRWTGSYPVLCSGMWEVYKDGEPINMRNCPFVDCDANTFGIYQSWHFDDDWIEVFEDYEDGLLINAWIKEYRDWLMEIDPSGNDWEVIYNGFRSQDWRRGSCGGCI